MVASGAHDVVLVVGGEKMPKGFIQTSGVEEDTDPEYLRQRCVGMPGPAFWALLCRQRMAEMGTTEEQLAKIAVKALKISVHNEYARFRKEFSLEMVLESNLVSDPLRLFEICPVSDGAAAAIICSAEKAKQTIMNQYTLHNCKALKKSCIQSMQFHIYKTEHSYRNYLHQMEWVHKYLKTTTEPYAKQMSPIWPPSSN